MKKIRPPLFICILVAFVIVLAAVAVIIGTMLSNQYHSNNLSSSFNRPITTSINYYSGIDLFGVKEIYPTSKGRLFMGIGAAWNEEAYTLFPHKNQEVKDGIDSGK
jgi:hypothetical protein